MAFDIFWTFDSVIGGLFAWRKIFDERFIRYVQIGTEPFYKFASLSVVYHTDSNLFMCKYIYFEKNP